MSNYTRVPDTQCLNCGTRLNRAGTFEDAPPPRPGDLTVCLRCGHLMVFTDELRMREPTDQEIIEVAGSEELLTTQRVLAAYREWKKHNPNGESK